MKKLFSSLVALSLLLSLSAPLSALAEVGDESVHFFESVDRLNQLNSYRVKQVINGQINVNPTRGSDESIDGDFTLIVKTETENKKSFQPNVFSDLNLVMNLKAEGENSPFSDLTFRTRFELKMLFGGDLYLRLKAFSVKAEGVPEDEKEGYELVQSGIDTVVSQLRGHWIQIPLKDLYSDLDESEVPENFQHFFDQEALSEELAKNGVKKTYQDLLTSLIDLAVESGEINTADRLKFESIVNEFFNTQFFTQKVLITGDDKGQHAFYMNRNRVFNFLVDMSNRFDQPLSLRDQLELKSLLRKFYISGKYNVNDEYGLFDDFQLKLSLRDIEELAQFELQYDYEVDQINQVEAVEAPQDFLNLKDLEAKMADFPLFGGFSDEAYFENELEDFELEDNFFEDTEPVSDIDLLK